MGHSSDVASDVVELAERLIAAPSVTPASGLAFDALEAMLAPLGFAITRFHAGEPPDGPVENLLAIRHGLRVYQDGQRRKPRCPGSISIRSP